MDRQDDPVAIQFSPGTLRGPYRMESKHGRGGMAELDSARDTRLGRTVAVKPWRSEYARQRDFRGRFAREESAFSARNYPHIYSLRDVREQDGL